MQQISTPELLVKHLYSETDAEETVILQNSLENDAKIAESYKQLQEVKNALDEAGGESPANSVIQHILEYSTQQELSTSH